MGSNTLRIIHGNMDGLIDRCPTKLPGYSEPRINLFFGLYALSNSNSNSYSMKINYNQCAMIFFSCLYISCFICMLILDVISMLKCQLFTIDYASDDNHSLGLREDAYGVVEIMSYWDSSRFRTNG